MGEKVIIFNVQCSIYMFKLAVILNPVLISCFKLYYFNRVQLISWTWAKVVVQLKVNETEIGQQCLVVPVECILLCSKEEKREEKKTNTFFGADLICDNT